MGHDMALLGTFWLGEPLVKKPCSLATSGAVGGGGGCAFLHFVEGFLLMMVHQV